MDELILDEDLRVTWASAPDPTLDDDRAALVRPIAAATCDFDHLMAAGRMPAVTPMPLGHECVAEVVDVGRGVRSVEVGQRVLLPFQINCGECGACRRGATSACVHLPWLSCYGLGVLGGSWGGLVSDLVVVPFADAMLVPVPDGVRAADVAAVGCNLVDAYRCVVPHLREMPGTDVLVLAGAFDNIAVYAAAMARVEGAGSVHVATDDDDVASRAVAVGAEPIATTDIPRDRYGIVADASMDVACLHRGLLAAVPAGVVTVSTMYRGRLTELPMMRLFERGLTLHTGQPHARALIDPVLEMITTGRLDPATGTTTVRPWHDAPTAFAAGSGKHVVVR